MTLPDLRHALVTAKERLRVVKEDHATMTAIREQAAIGDGRLAGCKNAEERARALLIALDQDDDYLESRDRLRTAEYEVDRLQAEIVVEEDARKTRELACRERNNDVVDRLAAAYEALARINPVHAAIDDSLMRNQRPF